LAVLHHHLSEWAREHHGVFTGAQAIDLGCSPSQLHRAVARGELVAVHRTLYRVAGAPTTWEQSVLLAVLAGGDGALASHRSAAWLRQLDPVRRGVPEITTPRHLRSWAPSLGICHESKDLRHAAPTEVRGIPTTGVCRTLLDLGAVVRSQEVVQAAIDDAMRRRLCTWDDLMHTLAIHSRRGRRGAGTLRSILAEFYGTTIPDSRFNRLVQRLILDSSLPAPAVEHEVFDDHRRLLARVDLAYPSRKIAIELDSRRYHLGAGAFERDRARQNQLELRGWLVLRFTWQTYVNRPHQIVGEIADALRDEVHRSGVVV
jgi:hypothetical protein